MNNVEDFEMEDLYSLDESEEFNGLQASASASSDTPEITPAMTATPVDAAANGGVGDGVTASTTASEMSGNERAMFLRLMENQQQLQEMLMATVQNQSRPGKTRRVYVPMPKTFDGKVGDYVENWLESFQVWFNHREKAEDVEMDEREKIDTAIQSCTENISRALRNHEARVHAWMTWDEFATHMRTTYSWKETVFQRYLNFTGLTQGEKETVDAFYARFTTAKTRQTKYIVAAEDEFMYTYMFMEQLRPEIMAEILRLPESKDSDTLGLQGILELAKRAEQTVISNPSQTGAIRKGCRHRNGASHPYSRKGNGGANSGNNVGGGT